MTPKADKGGGQESSAAQGGGGADSAKQQIDAVAQLEEAQNRNKDKFDWWFLMKFLIVCIIAFLLLLIALSNLKRGR